MSQFRAMQAACDLLGFPGADYDRWKTASDREGEPDREPNRECGPCERGDHKACWSEPPNKSHWYICLCKRGQHQ